MPPADSTLIPPGSTVLVTGAAGFIGSETCAALERAGYHVRALVRSRTVLSDRAEQHVGDLLDPRTISAAVEGTDAVVHTAGLAHGSKRNDPAEVVRVNVEGTMRLATEAAAARVRCFVYISSIAAAEGDRRSAPNTYALSKRAAEEALAKVAPSVPMRIVTLRPPMVFGPGMKGRPLLLLRLVQRGIPLPLASAIHKQSFMSSANLAAAIIASLQHEVKGEFDVADDTPISTTEFVASLGSALGRRVTQFRCPQWLFSSIGRIGDKYPLPFALNSSGVELLTRPRIIDNSTFRSATGFTPPYSVDQTLRAIAQWVATERS